MSFDLVNFYFSYSKILHVQLIILFILFFLFFVSCGININNYDPGNKNLYSVRRILYESGISTVGT